MELAALAEARLDELCAAWPLGYRPALCWRNMRVCAGVAHYIKGRITLSRILIVDPDRLERTLLHEYAHLMAYQRAGRAGANHGPAWQQAMRDLGQPPTVRHSYEVERKPAPLIYKCTKCGKEIGRHRALRRGYVYHHAACGGSLRFAGRRTDVDS